MIRKITITVILLCSLFSISAADTFFEESTNTVESWLNNTITDMELISDFERIGTTIESNEYHKKSLTQLYIGLAYFEYGDKKLSLKALENAQEQSELALMEGKTSENWRVDAEIKSYIMLQKGISYIIKNSNKVSDNAQKALDLDPANARASLIVAQGLINAPALFGGNIKKGIKTLENLTTRDDLKREDIFFIYKSLGDAYKKSKKRENAIKAFEKALEIFPKNQEISEELRSLKG